MSVNDLIHAGQKFQQDLFAVLVWFRRNAVAIACDISERYLQLKLTRSDCKHGAVKRTKLL